MGEWSKIYGSQATKKKAHLGKCTNYFSNLGVAEFLLQAGELNIGDEVIIIGPTTGTIKTVVSEIHLDSGGVAKAEKGNIFAIKVPDKVRRNDIIYKFEDADPLD
jgi:putative protease